MLIEVPDDLAAKLAARANAVGEDVETYAIKALHEIADGQTAILHAMELRIAELAFDLRRGRVTRNGHIVSLSRQEQQLLMLLLTQRDQPVSSLQISHDLWGSDSSGDYDNKVKVVISHLRTKLGDKGETAGQPIIRTVRHQGYMFVTTPHVTQHHHNHAA